MSPLPTSLPLCPLATYWERVFRIAGFPLVDLVTAGGGRGGDCHPVLPTEAVLGHIAELLQNSLSI